MEEILGHKIANLGIEISEGSDDAVARLEKILESNRDGLLPMTSDQPLPKI